MRGKLIGFGVFGLVINAFLYFHGGWMPILLIASVICLIAAIFVGEDTTG